MEDGEGQARGERQEYTREEYRDREQFKGNQTLF